LETFDVQHAFLPLTVAKLSTLKNGPVYFGPPCTLLDYRGTITRLCKVFVYRQKDNTQQKLITEHISIKGQSNCKAINQPPQRQLQNMSKRTGYL